MNHKFKLGAKILWKSSVNSIWHEATIIRIEDKFLKHITYSYKPIGKYGVVYGDIAYNNAKRMWADEHMIKARDAT